MPKLPRVSAKDLIRVFKKLGFEISAQKGSHVKMQDINARLIYDALHCFWMDCFIAMKRYANLACLTAY